MSKTIYIGKEEYYPWYYVATSPETYSRLKKYFTGVEVSEEVLERLKYLEGQVEVYQEELRQLCAEALKDE